jgi:protein-S-isoprenylcysteine O-methyltransferase Ste14
VRVRKPVAAVGSAIFFVIAPCFVAGLVPWWLTGWRARSLPDGWTWIGVPLWLVGGALVIAAASVLIAAFARFVTEGLGTPAPVAPPERLVIGGLYRHVRNPMYVAIISCILGQAMLLLQPVLLAYAALAAATMMAFVRFYEEPILSRQFGSAYAVYRANVRGWWPRLRPWRPSS